jgi:hypothetical protein
MSIVQEIEDEELNKELNCISFSEEIEFSVVNKLSDGYMTAIVKFCEEHGFDYSDIIKFISPSLKEKIQLEAEEQGLVKRKNKPAWIFE